MRSCPFFFCLSDASLFALLFFLASPFFSFFCVASAPPRFSLPCFTSFFTSAPRRFSFPCFSSSVLLLRCSSLLLLLHRGVLVFPVFVLLSFFFFALFFLLYLFVFFFFSFSFFVSRSLGVRSLGSFLLSIYPLGNLQYTCFFLNNILYKFCFMHFFVLLSSYCAFCM